MCGITGVISSNPIGETDLVAQCNRMTNSLKHRGPDDHGVWTEVQSNLALGQRRLSILDLSPLGHQPMLSHDHSLVIVYNGEVYNFQELRTTLEKHGYQFQGGSDTEVILASIQHWGIKNAVKKFIGMFAIALWDTRDKTLYLVRDRLGIKPLYYGKASDGSFVFGSELKALKAWQGFNNPLNLKALGLYFRHSYIPAPYSVFENIYKLPPGAILTLKKTAQQKTENFHIETYWQAEEVFLNGIENPWEGTDLEAIEALDQLLKDAIKIRLIADVPVGAFLSGGIDSSTVTAIMQSISNKQVRTFSIGFKECAYNEAPMARDVARHLNTDHTELYVTEQEARDVIPTISYFWDEPFADSSQIPTLLVSKLARDHVTVALSGDGGDELFSGYDRYTNTMNIWKKKSSIPSLLQGIIGSTLGVMPYSISKTTASIFKNLLKHLGATNPGAASIKRIAELLTSHTFSACYGYMNSNWIPPGGIMLMNNDAISEVFLKDWDRYQDNLWHLMTLLDLKTYLPDDILTKVDRATMGVALESRVPILDHRIVELSSRFNTKLRTQQNSSKWILKQVLYKYVPKKLIERPKMGFSVPIGQWLKGSLREWAEELILPDRLKKEGILNHKNIKRVWDDHISGKFNYEHTLWNILMFEMWLDKWR